MLITVIVVFLICWGPQLIFRILKYSDLNIYTQTHFQLQVRMFVVCLFFGGGSTDFDSYRYVILGRKSTECKLSAKHSIKLITM